MKLDARDVVGRIPGALEAIQYQRRDGAGYYDGDASAPRTGPYEHKVTSPTETLALRDGSLLIRPKGHTTKLWADIPDGGAQSLWYDNTPAALRKRRARTMAKRRHHRRHRRYRNSPGLAAFMNPRALSLGNFGNEASAFLLDGAIAGTGAVGVITLGNFVGSFYPQYYSGATLMPKAVRFVTRAGLGIAGLYATRHVGGHAYLRGGVAMGVGLATLLDLFGTSFTFGVGDDAQTIQSLLASISMPDLNLSGTGRWRRHRLLHGVEGADGVDGAGAFMQRTALAGAGATGAFMERRANVASIALRGVGPQRLTQNRLIPS